MDEWQDKARCKQLTVPVDFFPAPEDTQAIETAKSVCAKCPVAKQCRAFAQLLPDTVGIWGGELFELKDEDATGTAEET